VDAERYGRYRKESIANPNSIPAANNFAMAMDAQK
jgi:hypothetical protein